MEKWIKETNKSHVEYETYRHHSTRTSIHFTVKVNEAGEVVYCSDLFRMDNEESTPWKVNDNPGNITKEEFDVALEKLITYLRK